MQSIFRGLDSGDSICVLAFGSLRSDGRERCYIAILSLLDGHPDLCEVGKAQLVVLHQEASH